MCPYASCNDCCIVHSTSTGADPELVGGGGGGGGWSCMLLLHPVPTCADAGPDLCTLHPDLCTLCLWWLSPAATYGGGVSPLDVGTKTPLAPAVVSPIATCASGVYPSTHWHTYSTYTRATCTVVVVFGGDGGGRCICGGCSYDVVVGKCIGVIRLHMRWPFFNLHWLCWYFEVTGGKSS